MALIIETHSKIRRRNNIGIILLTILFLGLGYYFTSIHFLNKEWISRSGSLIVVLGILSGFSGIIQERLLMSKLEVRMRLALLQKKRKLRILKVEKEFVGKELVSIEQEFAEKAKELTQSIKYSVGLIEGVLLILGTIVWGFGDLTLALM